MLSELNIRFTTEPLVPHITRDMFVRLHFSGRIYSTRCPLFTSVYVNGEPSSTYALSGSALMLSLPVLSMVTLALPPCTLIQTSMPCAALTSDLK